MLYEIKNARPFDAGKKTRWFSDHYFDLTVWIDQSGAVDQFQLTYDRLRDPRALTWRSGKGFLHERVDDGEVAGRHKKSPILVADGTFGNGVAALFEAESAEIDTEVREFVLERLKEFTEKQEA